MKYLIYVAFIAIFLGCTASKEVLIEKTQSVEYERIKVSREINYSDSLRLTEIPPDAVILDSTLVEIITPKKVIRKKKLTAKIEDKTSVDIFYTQTIDSGTVIMEIDSIGVEYEKETVTIKEKKETTIVKWSLYKYAFWILAGVAGVLIAILIIRKFFR